MEQEGVSVEEATKRALHDLNTQKDFSHMEGVTKEGSKSIIDARPYKRMEEFTEGVKKGVKCTVIMGVFQKLIEKNYLAMCASKAGKVAEKVAEKVVK